MILVNFVPVRSRRVVVGRAHQPTIRPAISIVEISPDVFVSAAIDNHHAGFSHSLGACIRAAPCTVGVIMPAVDA